MAKASFSSFIEEARGFFRLNFTEEKILVVKPFFRRICFLCIKSGCFILSGNIIFDVLFIVVGSEPQCLTRAEIKIEKKTRRCQTLFGRPVEIISLHWLSLL